MGWLERGELSGVQWGELRRGGVPLPPRSTEPGDAGPGPTLVKLGKDSDSAPENEYARERRCPICPRYL